MKYIHFSDEVVFGDVRKELCSDIHNSTFHCHPEFSSSCFPLNLFSPNLVEIVCVVSTESGSRWGERGGIQSSKWQNIIMQRKCICCGHFPAVINKNNVGMDNLQASWSVDKSKSLKRKFYFLLEGEGGAVRVGR